jgi:hypothetical protein
MATGGHPGLFRWYVDHLVDAFRPGPRCAAPTEQEMLDVLNAPATLDAVAATRAVPNRILAEHVDLVNRLLESSPLLPASLQAEELSYLITCGFVARDSQEQLDFAAPVLRQIILKKLTARPGPGSYSSEPASLEQCVLAALSRLHSRSLRQTWSTNLAGDRVCETKWQHLFYHALLDSVPSAWIVSPDFGHAVGCLGKLDFYVSSDKGIAWGVELLVSGDGLPEHIGRFKAGGVYHQLLEQKLLKEWVILDFRRTRPRKVSGANVWEAVYSPDYASLTVYRQGHPPHKVKSPGRCCGAAAAISG